MKMDIELWQKRLSAYSREAIRYWSIIFSSGFVLALYFILVVGGFYYRKWLGNLPADFPSALLIATIMMVLLTTGAVRTFVKEADLVFLLPYEGEMRSYFRRSFVYSLLIQTFLILVFIFLLAPLYFAQINDSASYLLLSLGLLVLAKSWNLFANFQEQRLQDRNERHLHIFLRLAVNALFCFFLFQEAWVFMLCIVVIMLLMLFVYYRHFSKRHSLKWERLMEIERKQLLFFYRIANAFTDVPALKGAIKRRGWADLLLGFIKYDTNHAFTYLFARSFFRYGDFLGIYLRLIVIGGLFIYLVPDIMVQIAVLLAFILMTGMQLSTLWFQYDAKIWLDLYPLDEGKKKANFSLLLFVLLIIQMVIYALVMIMSSHDWRYFLVSLILGGLFTYLYSYILVNKRKKAV